MTAPGSRLNRSIPKVAPEQAFIVTVGVSHANTQSDCRRALEALERAGFECGATSDESIEIIAGQKRLVDGLVQNDPEGAEQ